MSFTVALIFMVLTTIMSVCVMFIKKPVVELVAYGFTAIFAILSAIALYASGQHWLVVAFWLFISLLWFSGTLYKASKI
jgi:hypothetical protein